MNKRIRKKRAKRQALQLERAYALFRKCVASAEEHERLLIHGRQTGRAFIFADQLEDRTPIFFSTPKHNA